MTGVRPASEKGPVAVSYRTGSDSGADVIDAVRLGELLKGYRYAAGYSRVSDMTAALKERFGVTISVSAIGKYEQGRTIPPVEMLILLCAIMEPNGGLVEIVSKATRPDLRERVFGSP